MGIRRKKMLLQFIYLVIGLTSCTGFLIDSKILSHASLKGQRTTTNIGLKSKTFLLALNDEEEEEEESFLDLSLFRENKSSDFDKENLNKPKLGIDIGSQLNPLTPEQISSLQDEARQEVDRAFEKSMVDIESIKAESREDLENSLKEMRTKSDARVKAESEKLMGKIDSITQDFLSQNEKFSEESAIVLKADRAMAESGRGVDIGSWGTLNGVDVALTSTTVDSQSSMGLFGSVQGVDDASTASQPSQNKILIVCGNDKQDAGIKRALDKFSTLLASTFDQGFDDTVLVDMYTPTSSIPLGGNGANTAIIVASSINGGSSCANILSTLLKQSFQKGKVCKPPSHFVVISSLGTERIDKFPYSVKNFMGGKLTKQREVEETVINAVKGRKRDQVPLDYTIVKLGDIIDDDKVKGTDDFQINPGDSLDGEVGVDAVSKIILQAVAFQPSARNATFSIVGGMKEGISRDENFWSDGFLCLDGPELLRIDVESGASDKETNEKYEKLATFIEEWSKMFEGKAKGTGLTTPVTLRISKRLPDNVCVLRRFGVRLEFKETNTGSAYFSKGEEASKERQQGNYKTQYAEKNVDSIKPRRQNNQGGVEVIVEQTVSGGLRVRARRCNLDDSTVIKEISEETILKKIQSAVNSWSQL